MASGFFLGGVGRGLEGISQQFRESGERQSREEQFGKLFGLKEKQFGLEERKVATAEKQQDQELALKELTFITDQLQQVATTQGPAAAAKMVGMIQSGAGAAGIKGLQARLPTIDVARRLQLSASGATAEQQGARAGQRGVAGTAAIAKGLGEPVADVARAQGQLPKPETGVQAFTDQNNNRMLAFFDKDNPSQITTVKIGTAREPFDFNRFRSDLALRIEGRTVKMKSVQEMTSEQAKAVLDNLGNQGLLESLLGLAGGTSSPSAVPAGDGMSQIEFQDLLFRAVTNDKSVTDAELAKLSPEQRKILRLAKPGQDLPAATVSPPLGRN